jgi:hypothetical protein
MTISPRLLLAALLGLNTGAVFAEVYLPDFTLNSKKASDVKHWPRPFDFPIPVPTNMGIYFYGDGRGPVPARIPYKAGHVQTTSSISVKVEGKKGKAEIAFPRVEFEKQRTGDRSSFFIKVSSEASSPVLSWAAIICSGRNYLGYKGASLKLPEKSGVFSVDDTTLALGGLGALVRKTHPWLIAGLDGGGRSLDPLCSVDFTKKMKEYNVETLPVELDGFNFGYDAGKNILNITWRAGR